MLADVRLEHDRPYEFPRFSTKEVLVVGIRIEHDLWRLILPFQDPMPLDQRIQRSVEAVFKQSRYETIWKSEFRLHRRLTSEFVKGRVALAGDAAHLNSPVGGQGMNAGIQDADILCECLVRALSKNKPKELEEYQQKRQIAVEVGVNRFTNQLTEVMMFQRGRLWRPVLALVAQALRFERLRRPFLRKVAMLAS